MGGVLVFLFFILLATFSFFSGNDDFESRFFC